MPSNNQPEVRDEVCFELANGNRISIFVFPDHTVRVTEDSPKGEVKAFEVRPLTRAEYEASEAKLNPPGFIGLTYEQRYCAWLENTYGK